MAVEILGGMARLGFEEVVALVDQDSGLRAFLGVHSTRLGPAFGGVRRWSYRDEGEALRDCLRLSRAMSHKCALAGLPAGGGKVVVLDGPELDAERAYRHLGRVVERMSGRFYTGPDVGTGTSELSWLSQETRFAAPPGGEGPGELAESTCEGVFHGMAAALRHLDGAEDWPSRTVVVQGLGEVGRGLARKLVARGSRVLAADIDRKRAQSVARELELELIDPSSEYDRECDVFAPCALGGILHDLTLPRLRARIVAGGANNILARPEHADRLHERGVLYAPDLVINSGALIRGALFFLEGRREPVERIGARVGDTLERILDKARERDLSPARVAEEEAERRIG